MYNENEHKRIDNISLVYNENVSKTHIVGNVSLHIQKMKGKGHYKFDINIDYLPTGSNYIYKKDLIKNIDEFKDFIKRINKNYKWISINESWEFGTKKECNEYKKQLSKFCKMYNLNYL